MVKKSFRNLFVGICCGSNHLFTPSRHVDRPLAGKTTASSRIQGRASNLPVTSVASCHESSLTIIANDQASSTIISHQFSFKINNQLAKPPSWTLIMNPDHQPQLSTITPIHGTCSFSRQPYQLLGDLAVRWWLDRSNQVVQKRCSYQLNVAL